jgi:hypothetical protein
MTANNVNKVPRVMWRKWSVDHRELFNRVYDAMKQQDIFMHPDQFPMEIEHWDTIRWNAAFTAAEELRRMP